MYAQSWKLRMVIAYLLILIIEFAKTENYYIQLYL